MRWNRQSDTLDKNISASNAPAIAFFVTEDWYFCSHRLPLAVAALNAGYAVFVITRVTSHGDVIASAGLNLIPIELSRRSRNPFKEAATLKQLIGIYKSVQPQIVHHVALKPVIYGSIAARVSRVPGVVNALAGMGYLFSSTATKARLLRPVVRTVFRMLLNNARARLILQNPDDVEMICGSGIVDASRVKLIMGSGVDTNEFQHHAEPGGTPTVLLASRMLWDKGVGEFVDAARILNREGVVARFVLAGVGDDENPGSIRASQLEAWQAEGDVEWWGRCSAMPAVIAGAHIVCLPTSYGEGVPKVLIEAASCGRPIVATDAPGCREIVQDGTNGILVPVKDVGALVEAIRELLSSPDTRRSMGNAGRRLVTEKFSLGAVIEQTLAVYESMAE